MTSVGPTLPKGVTANQLKSEYTAMNDLIARRTGLTPTGNICQLIGDVDDEV